MSTNLYLRPIPPEDEAFAYELKFSLAPRLWGHDGSLSGDWTKVDRDLIPFLEGVLAGAPKDSERAKEALSLIKAIEKHGSVELRLR